MKKKFLVVTMLIVVIMTAILLTACNTNKMSLGFMLNGNDDTEIFVEVNINKYEGKTLADLFLAEDSFEAQLEEGEFGYYFVGLKGVVPKDNQFINTYTSSEEFRDTSEYASDPIVKDGITYYQSNKGLSYLPVSKDIKYLFVLISF